MIALLDNEEYFISGDDNIKDFLIAYADYIGLDIKIFKKEKICCLKLIYVL